MTTLLQSVGDYLEDAGCTADVLVVGGAVLALRGWVDRATHDIDVIALRGPGTQRWQPPQFAPGLVDAIRRVARDRGLADDWMNTAVAMQWQTGLPPDLADGVEWRRFGALQVGLCGRQMMLALKLFATADRGPDSVHCRDLIALTPTDHELQDAARWVLTQDIAVEWPQIVAEVIEHVRSHRRIR